MNLTRPALSRLITPLIVATAAIVLLARHGTYRYQYDAPRPPAISFDAALAQSLLGFTQRSMQAGPPAAVLREGDPGLSRWLAGIGEALTDYAELADAPRYLDTARVALVRAAQLDKSQPRTFHILANANMQARDYEAAHRYFIRALWLDSSKVSSLYSLGIVYWRYRENKDSAALLMEQCLALYPACPGASYVLGEIMLAKGSRDSATALLERESARAGARLPGALAPEPRRVAVLAPRNACLRLMSLHATRPGSRAKARMFYERFMQLESSESRRAVIAEQWRSLSAGK